MSHRGRLGLTGGWSTSEIQAPIDPWGHGASLPLLRAGLRVLVSTQKGVSQGKIIARDGDHWIVRVDLVRQVNGIAVPCGTARKPFHAVFLKQAENK